ncbi:hypothetical protein [Paenibacillus glycanilyticus]|uniref:Uncharacterized protein n=1 Tax=Paenibacillus glycanilyticus TaxID=126569 RepID=A0ABQ6GGB8_9BACL|nr:hypothetical protein [Paenibacillus glycanilyticus]GLX69999.1 hypothetical protein MU1_43450 [Paenibacillus glycanilyticus]
MKLITNTNPYRLEQGSEMDFGRAVYETMAKVILAFREPETDILFQYTNWDKDKDPHKENLILDAAETYHAGAILDPDQTIGQAVKEILLQHYAPERDPKESKAVMDQLLAYFKEVPFEELNEEVLRKIGSIVHEDQAVYTLEDKDEATQEFVNRRLVDTNSVWLLPYDRPVYLKNILWYRANSEEDIIHSFELADWWFTCAVVERDRAVEEYRYFLNYTEDGDGGMVLLISAADERHFKAAVIPRIQELLGDSLEIVE